MNSCVDIKSFFGIEIGVGFSVVQWQNISVIVSLLFTFRTTKIKHFKFSKSETGSDVGVQLVL
jgi:hypothetical protein